MNKSMNEQTNEQTLIVNECLIFQAVEKLIGETKIKLKIRPEIVLQIILR